MIIGHEKVLSYLDVLLRAREGGRNILLLGPQGIGKRLLATMYAQALLCENNNLLKNLACTCGSCQAYLHNIHPDSMVVDCAVAGGVADMRILKETLSRTPLRGRRVVIFDNAEAMTLEAGNALLKTLEEPRSDTAFLMIVHRDTIPVTVRSRFEIIRMGLVSQEALLDSRGDISPEDAELLKYLSGGRPGTLMALRENTRALERARSYSAHLVTFLRGSIYQRMRYFDTVKEEDRREEFAHWPHMLMDYLSSTAGVPQFFPRRYHNDLQFAAFPSVLLLKALRGLLHIEELKHRYNLNTSLLEEQLTLI